ncbi:hypothetical protein E2C01_035931 [Portunus trituberculatus]|uniref:Secreted protein n=1 Tax=Portunus trituberculatus TaxID=210409 RepID=A0A5B7FB21_PORTR|nr:hypothetical protein [Portunus trituberculatus]
MARSQVGILLLVSQAAGALAANTSCLMWKGMMAPGMRKQMFSEVTWRKNEFSPRCALMMSGARLWRG